MALVIMWQVNMLLWWSLCRQTLLVISEVTSHKDINTNTKKWISTLYSYSHLMEHKRLIKIVSLRMELHIIWSTCHLDVKPCEPGSLKVMTSHLCNMSGASTLNWERENRRLAKTKQLQITDGCKKRSLHCKVLKHHIFKSSQTCVTINL